MDYSLEVQQLFSKTFDIDPELLTVLLTRLEQTATEAKISKWSEILFLNNIDQIESVFEEMQYYYDKGVDKLEGQIS